jgi:hypothetical protein
VGSTFTASIARTDPPARDFGAPIRLETPTPLAQIVAEPDGFAGKTVLICGRVTDVCQRKGCWTVIAEADSFVRVVFEDYGFFLPKDSRGRTALAEGKVRVEMQSEKVARHYAEESLTGSPGAIVGPQRVVTFTASGIRLLDAVP